jgi:hypothetical protein
VKRAVIIVDVISAAFGTAEFRRSLIEAALEPSAETDICAVTMVMT